MSENGKAAQDPTDSLAHWFQRFLKPGNPLFIGTLPRKPSMQSRATGALWPERTCSAPCHHLLKTTTSGSFLSAYKHTNHWAQRPFYHWAKVTQCVRDSAGTTACASEPPVQCLSAVQSRGRVSD